MANTDPGGSGFVCAYFSLCKFREIIYVMKIDKIWTLQVVGMIMSKDYRGSTELAHRCCTLLAQYVAFCESYDITYMISSATYTVADQYCQYGSTCRV